MSSHRSSYNHSRPRTPSIIVIQQPHEHQRSRSPPITIVQQPYPSRSRHSPPPGFIQQPHTRTSYRSRSPPSIVHQTHGRSPWVHEYHRSRSPPVVVQQQPYYASRPYESQNSRTPPVSTQQPYYGRNSRTPPVIIQHGYDRRSPTPVIPGPYDESSYRRRSSSSVHGRSSTYRDRPTVIVVPGGEDAYEASNHAQDQQVYTAIDPFRPSVASSINFGPPPHAEYYYDIDTKTHYPSSYAPYPITRRTAWKTLLADGFKLFWVFFFDALPRRIYLYFLLGLPAFYFSRVTRIFEETDMTVEQIKDLPYSTLGPMAEPNAKMLDWEVAIPARLKDAWESFIDSLLREWKTLNIVSVLLMTCVPWIKLRLMIVDGLFVSSAILTVLQIPSAQDDPIARHSALLSLVCALMSLMYGCIYIIRFASMRKPYKATEWAAVRISFP
jgi:hypothetical protein